MLMSPLDYGLFIAVLFLLGFGIIMVASASMPIGAQQPYNEPLYYVYRHLVALIIGLMVSIVCFKIPMTRWERGSTWLFLLGIGLLIAVLVPGIGYSVNGATRWIRFGPMNLQISEFMKLFAVLYISGYLVRRSVEVSTELLGFVRPMVLVGIASALIIVQPDLGTAAVLLVTVFGLFFLGGVPLFHFIVLFCLMILALVTLIWIEPYRLIRVMSFLKPFDDPFNSGYQLSQALIAFGRGEWFGVGLGNGIQKHYFLPEAHTDFLLAVVGEEFGLFGVTVIILTFAFIVWRAFTIGSQARKAEQIFNSFVAYGIGLLLGLQAFINAGVNTGLLPTKGLTLPFMSYGSNAIITTMMAAALLLRIDREYRAKSGQALPPGGRRWVRV
jgi:cell division protein FtsW